MNAEKVAYATREAAVGKCNEKEDQGSPRQADAVDPHAKTARPREQQDEQELSSDFPQA